MVVVTGQILVVPAPSWLRELVHYGHTAFLYNDELRAGASSQRAPFVLETGPLGVRDLPWDHTGDVYEVKNAGWNGAKAVWWAKQHRGMRYGYENVWRYVLEAFRRKIRPERLVAVAYDTRPVCHQLVIDGYWLGGGMDIVPGVVVPLPDDIARSALTRRVA